MLAALDAVTEELAAATFAFLPSDEDIHTAIERRVSPSWSATPAPSCTPVAAATTRWRPTCGSGCKRRARRDAGGTIVGLPARSSARRRPTRRASCPATPTCSGPSRCSLAHHLLAHCEMLAARRRAPLATWRRANVSPLGAGALAGSTLPLDRTARRADLGFAGRARQQPGRGQRPRLRRRVRLRLRARRRCTCRGWARSWILWTTRSSASSTCPTPSPPARSIMPQKKNPDVAELIRGKTGRRVGNLVALARAREGPAAGLQPRPAGGQGAAVRRRRPGVAGAGRGRLA